STSTSASNSGRSPPGRSAGARSARSTGSANASRSRSSAPDRRRRRRCDRLKACVGRCVAAPAIVSSARRTGSEGWVGPSNVHLGYFTKFGPPAWKATDSRTDGSDWANGRYFVDLARRLDAACLDFLFFEDTLSVSEAVGGSRDLDLKYAIYAPMSDPLPLLPLLAHATTGLGLIATTSTTFYPPWHVARLFSTVDSLCSGRVGFNVVTTSEKTSAQNFGLAQMPSHADRYAMAAEFLDVVNGLWDGWREGALLQDVDTNTYVDASKVHALDHAGAFFRARGPLNSPRSPQGR